MHRDCLGRRPGGSAAHRRALPGPTEPRIRSSAIPDGRTHRRGGDHRETRIALDRCRRSRRRSTRVRAVVALAPLGRALPAAVTDECPGRRVSVYAAGLDRWPVPRFHADWIARDLPRATSIGRQRLAFCFMDPPSAPILTPMATRLRIRRASTIGPFSSGCRRRSATASTRRSQTRRDAMAAAEVQATRFFCAATEPAHWSGGRGRRCVS